MNILANIACVWGNCKIFARYDWKPNVGIWLLFDTKLHVLWPRRTGRCIQVYHVRILHSHGWLRFKRGAHCDMATADMVADWLVILTGSFQFEMILAHGGMAGTGTGFVQQLALVHCIYRAALHSIIDTRFSNPLHIIRLVKVFGSMGYRKRKRSAPVLSTASAGLVARGKDPGP